MGMEHRHRVETTERKAEWTHCVLPVSYYPYDPRERRRHDLAHGGFVEIRRCSCGAEQRAEVNLGRKNIGPWVERTQGQVKPLDMIGGIRVQYQGREVDILVQQIDAWISLRRTAGADLRYVPATIELENGDPVVVNFVGNNGDPVTAEVAD